MRDAEPVVSRRSKGKPSKSKSRKPRAPNSGRWSVQLEHLGGILQHLEQDTRDKIAREAPEMTLDRTRRRLIVELTREGTANTGTRKVGLDSFFSALSDEIVTEIGDAANAVLDDPSADESTKRSAKRVQKIVPEFLKKRRFRQKKDPSLRREKPTNPSESRRTSKISVKKSRPSVAAQATRASTKKPRLTDEQKRALEPRVFNFLKRSVAELDRPTDFATLSNLVKHEFGEQASAGWFGFKTFKRLLAAAVPDAVLIPEGSSFVLPNGWDAESFTAPEVVRRPIPKPVKLIRRADPSFPNIEAEAWPYLYRSLSQATGTVGWRGDPTVRTVNACCTEARSLTENGAGLRLGRKEFNYVAWMLYSRQCLRREMSPLEIEDSFADALLRRCKRAKFTEREMKEVRAWIGRYPGKL